MKIKHWHELFTQCLGLQEYSLSLQNVSLSRFILDYEKLLVVKASLWFQLPLFLLHNFCAVLCEDARD